jgi:hypothetical protein
LGVVITLPALAQQPPAAYPVPCDANKVSRADIDRAHSVFLIGKQYLEESNYDKAIGYFDDAYTIDCSVHAILPIIATAYERKGDKGEAIRALDEYQRRAPQAPDHEVIERRIRNLKDQLAREAPPLVAPSPVVPAATATPAPPPAAPGGTEPAPIASSIAPNGTVEAAPPAPTPTTEGAQHGTAPWIVTGVGGAVVVAGAAVLTVGLIDEKSASSSCPARNHCPADIVSKGNTGLTLQSVGYSLLGGGAAIVAAGLVWHFLEPQPKSSKPSAQAIPVVGPGYAGIAVGGSL